MRKYIIFRTETASAEGWRDRQLAHTGALTSILAEHFDSSKKPLPKPGYRVPEFYTIEKFADPRFPGARTHVRAGDWEVTRVEEYPTGAPDSEFDAIVICYCKYSPIDSPLEPMPKIQVPQEYQEVQA